jgi:DNA-binding transcriptional MocR family regulator
MAPETGTVGFVRLKGESVDTLNERLSARESLVVPGRFFGVADHFRMGFGMEEPQLTEGLKRLATALGEA